MSDFSALSHDYELSARMAMELAERLLNVRRRSGATLPASERESLKGMLASVRRQLSGERMTETNLYVPDEIIRRIEARHSGRIEYVVNDISKAMTDLDGDAAVSEETLRTLDLICEAADVSASEMYRRLRRR
jgi:hypothetical protein